MITRRTLSTAFTLVAVLLVLSAPAIADEHEDEEEDDGPIISLDGVRDAIDDLVGDFSDFVDNLEDTLVSAGLTLFVKPFQLLAQLLSDILTHVIVSYPDVRHPEVLDLHWLIYQLTLLLSVPGFIWIGFRHMTNRADGIRPTVHLLGLLVAGGVAPWLLHYPVKASELTTVAIQSETVPVMGMLNLSLMTAVVIWFKAIILLVLVLVYVVRDFYLMFFTVSAPLIFLLLYFRPTRDHVAPLLGLFIGFLLIGPLDMIAYRLVLALLDMNAGSPVPHYIWGLGGYCVMLALPYVILSSGTSMTLPAASVAKSAAAKTGAQVKPVVRQQVSKTWENRAPQNIRNRVNNRFGQDREQKNRESDGGDYWWRGEW